MADNESLSDRLPISKIFYRLMRKKTGNNNNLNVHNLNQNNETRVFILQTMFTSIDGM
jgi:hypothetical protein